jgi:Protein of unknown function, DUF488
VGSVVLDIEDTFEFEIKGLRLLFKQVLEARLRNRTAACLGHGSTKSEHAGLRCLDSGQPSPQRQPDDDVAGDSQGARRLHPSDGAEAIAVELATSRYQAKDLIVASSFVPVGISIGKPKFPLGYECVYMTRLAPWGLREIGDDEEFTRRYRERLDAIGIAATRRRFLSISAEHDERGLALLCFEPVGTFCHRRVLASWFEEQTGQHIPELEPLVLGQGRLPCH